MQTRHVLVLNSYPEPPPLSKILYMPLLDHGCFIHLLIQVLIGTDGRRESTICTCLLYSVNYISLNKWKVIFSLP